MKYTVEIGFNVKLAPGETWPAPGPPARAGRRAGGAPKKGPGVLLELDPPEVRFEPGEKLTKLPIQADVDMLLSLGALVPLEEEAPYG